MFAKVLILALAVSANARVVDLSYGSFNSINLSGGIPIPGANQWGYTSNVAHVVPVGAVRPISTRSGIALRFGGDDGVGFPGEPDEPGTGFPEPRITPFSVPTPDRPRDLPLGNVLLPTPGWNGYLPNLSIGRGLPVYQAGPVNAAVHTVSRTVDYRPVPNIGEPPVIQDINVPPQESPLRINFQSKSSPLILTQQHIPAEPGQIQVTQSADEPHTVIHNVLRPVVQRVNEVVQPYRTLTQTVEPVIEQTHTNIAQGEGVRLTGLTSAVVRGNGVIAASGLGIVAPPAVRVGAPIGVAKVGGLGYGLRAVAPAGGVIGSLRTVGLSNRGLYGAGVARGNVGIISQWGK